jgi:hypothetical protein
MAIIGGPSIGLVRVNRVTLAVGGRFRSTSMNGHCQTAPRHVGLVPETEAPFVRPSVILVSTGRIAVLLALASVRASRIGLGNSIHPSARGNPYLRSVRGNPPHPRHKRTAPGSHFVNAASQARRLSSSSVTRLCCLRNDDNGSDGRCTHEFNQCRS